MEVITQTQKSGIAQEKQEKTTGFFAAASELLSSLPQRSQEIAKKRFGLSGEKPQTLEKIGRDHGITRERVRQIIADAIKKISSMANDATFKRAEDKIIFTIESRSGIIKKSELLKKLSSSDSKEANSLVFLRECSSRILVAEEGGEKIWFLDRSKLAKAKEVVLTVQEILEKERKLFSDEEIIKKTISVRPEFSEVEILSYVGIFPFIKKNKFGKWGMADWVEVSPKGTRERIYSVLKEKGKPLHFTEIARLIDEYALSKRKAHVQTVHNELIKNDQFVLIGRGIYALKEWGYAKGTIRDVLENILLKSKRSLSRDEILKEVSRIRRVKKATILINLSNSKLFVKQNDLYSVKKS